MKGLTVRTRHLAAIAALAISTGASASAGVIVLNVPNANQTVLNGISNDFTLVGTYEVNGYYYSFTYNPSTNVWHYPINVPNEAQTTAWSTNTLGQLVGYYAEPYWQNSQYFFGFAEWKSGVFSELFVNECIEGIQPAGINDNSAVTGSCITGVESNGQQIQMAFETYPADVTFACFGSVATVPYAVNNFGQMVGFFLGGGGVPNGFISTDQGYCSVVNYPGAGSTVLTGINDVGDITGFYTKGSGNVQSFILKGSTYTPVNIPGATAVSIGQINNDGWYVGNYVDSKGQHAFFAHTAP
jgi:hypothetical protein